MKISWGFVAFAYALQTLHLVAAQTLASQNVTAYIARERQIAKANVLANIGSSGSKSAGAKAGVVIASPSTTNPNYLYTWVRDSSLVFKMLIDQFTLGLDTSLKPLIDQFVSAESKLQQTSNPSGTVTSGGLGEPKFNIDLTAFTDGWGRPQRDGPALRATALITYANWLISNGQKSTAQSTLWPMIKLDLDYVATYWNETTFDLWEEVSSSSFFTSAVQLRSLREGYTLANALGQVSGSVTSYPTQSSNILCFMQSFWNPSGKYIVANTGGGRSGIDINGVLASIHTFDPAAGCDATTFQPCSDKALANLWTYVNSFKNVYGLNSGLKATDPLATGRYPEDVYYNGNPWYLATFGVAEQLYDAYNVWTSQGSLTVTSLSQPFFQAFLSSVTPGTYTSSSSTFKTLTAAVRTYADAYIARASLHTPTDGGLAEQYDKNTGFALSAVDLTWSYASAITAFQARDGVKYASWGAQGLTLPSGTCQGGGANRVQVTFNVQATTVTGENIFLVGSLTELQNWATGSAIALSSASYPKWSVQVGLPSNTLLEYKYIRVKNAVVTWESDPNLQITTPASGNLTLNDSWR